MGRENSPKVPNRDVFSGRILKVQIAINLSGMCPAGISVGISVSTSMRLSFAGGLLHQPKIYRMPNRLIVSDTNNGKTSLIRRFLRLHERLEDLSAGQSFIPVLLGR